MAQGPMIPSKAEVKAVIPEHCFERSAVHGLMYVARDLAMAAALFAAAYYTLPVSAPSDWMGYLGWAVGWNLYAFWQGAVLTGLWVLAHECGHGSFSPNQTFNDCVGFVLHTALLVPYFAWQFSHKKHHIRTNHLLDGESHVPPTAKGMGVVDGIHKKGMAKVHDAIGEEAFAILQLVGHLVFGWPLYLLRNDSGGRRNADGTRKQGKDMLDHFRPSSKLFPSRVQTKISIGTCGILGWIVFLVWCGQKTSSMHVLNFYVGPYMWVNAWLVLYTWLQHTDSTVPHYGEAEWTWMKGALGTIDRPYGIFDFFHHKIGSTHVVHHLFHEIPFYHADEATVHVKAKLGKLYNYDGTFLPIAAYKVAKECHYVESVEGVQYQKSLSKSVGKKAE